MEPSASVDVIGSTFLPARCPPPAASLAHCLSEHHSHILSSHLFFIPHGKLTTPLPAVFLLQIMGQNLVTSLLIQPITTKGNAVIVTNFFFIDHEMSLIFLAEIKVFLFPTPHPQSPGKRDVGQTSVLLGNTLVFTSIISKTPRNNKKQLI